MSKKIKRIKETGKEEGKKNINGEFSKKAQVKKHNKILRNFLIGMAIFVVLIFLVWYAIESIKKFEYAGVNFKIVKFCDSKPCLVMYNTKIPVVYEGKNAEYNFYLRNDPRKIGGEVPFDGNLSLARNLVLNGIENFTCNGDGIIAIANLQNLYQISGINMIRDGNATCDSEGRYAFMVLRPENQTGIEKFGPSCYNIKIIVKFLKPQRGLCWNLLLKLIN